MNFKSILRIAFRVTITLILIGMLSSSSQI